MPNVLIVDFTSDKLKKMCFFSTADRKHGSFAAMGYEWLGSQTAWCWWMMNGVYCQEKGILSAVTVNIPSKRLYRKYFMWEWILLSIMHAGTACWESSYKSCPTPSQFATISSSIFLSAFQTQWGSQKVWKVMPGSLNSATVKGEGTGTWETLQRHFKN